MRRPAKAPPQPQPTARADLAPGTGPVLSDYRIEDLRWAEMPPIDPTKEQFRGPGLEPMARAPYAMVAGPPPAPADYRPGLAHTAAYALMPKAPSVATGRLGTATGQRSPQPLQPSYPAGEMLPQVRIQRNFARFEPGPLRDQAPYTIGLEE